MKSLVTIGNFDGVHKGHQSLITALNERKRSYGGPSKSVVFTFEPHPREVLSGKPVERLSTAESKVELLKKAGADEVRVLPFSKSFSQTEPRDFFESVIIQGLDVAYVAVGKNFFFGRNREGTPERILEWSAEKKIDAEIVSGVQADGEIISSSRIRELIKEGKMNAVSRLLGRDYSFSGTVSKGDQRGRALGFPTANLYPQRDVVGSLCLPAPGVYLTSVSIPEEHKTFAAVTNAGYKPTIGDDEPFCVESHLLNFSGDLYEKVMLVEFKDRIRPEMKFENLEALVEQIRKDIALARSRLA